MVSVQQFYTVCFSLQYLSCLSTSSSNDKLAFDVGLKEKAQGNVGICTKILMILCRCLRLKTLFKDVYFLCPPSKKGGAYCFAAVGRSVGQPINSFVHFFAKDVHIEMKFSMQVHHDNI